MAANGFVWFELITSDIDAACAFYQPLLGWTTYDFPNGTDRYAIQEAEGQGVAGFMRLPQHITHPFWIGYIGTPDREAALSRWTAGGGTIQRQPWEIPSVGRLAVVKDPQGTPVALIQGSSPQPSAAFSPGKPGHGNWNELHTPDPSAAMEFYAGQFGWTAGEVLNMGPAGTYHLVLQEGSQMGGMMASAPEQLGSWLFYFGVPDIRAASERITAGGGTVVNGPMQVPGGSWIIQARDPQGAIIAVVAPS